MIPIACAWAGCRDSFAGELPPGWLWLATFSHNAEPGVLRFRSDPVRRDAALCPAHVAALEQQLKRID